MAKRQPDYTGITPDRKNANKGTERGRYMVEASLRETGAGRSILLDKDGRIIAGNKTFEAASDIGLPLRVIQTDGSELVAVQRTDLDLDDDTGTARKLAYYDNRTSSIGLEWDAEQVMSDLAAGLDLSAMFRQDELDELLADLQPKAEITAPTVPQVYTQEQVIEAAFTWFRANGFPYRNLAPHVSMQEINRLLTTEPDKLINTDTAYHVADTYHPHRFHAAAEGMKSPFDAFMDDKDLRRAMKLNQENGYTLPQEAFGQMWIVSGTQAAANFRPGFAAYIYRQFCPPNATVLDTSTGYGGRLVGFIGSGVDGFYIGIDPNTQTHAGNLRMAQELLFADRVELHNMPAEDVPHDAVAGRCDFAFTSPPYFRKEHYSDEDTQSWKRYQTGDAWRNGFLAPMMALQYAALKPNRYAVVNIADVKIKNKVYPLADWTIDAGKAAGFEFVRRDEFPLSHRFGANHLDEIAVEPVLVFRKN